MKKKTKKQKTFYTTRGQTEQAKKINK